MRQSSGISSIIFTIFRRQHLKKGIEVEFYPIFGLPESKLSIVFSGLDGT
jgi:hypothetical protein